MTAAEEKELEVIFDRVGAVFTAGEKVTGVVRAFSKGTTSHNGITLTVEGTVACHSNPKLNSQFDAVAEQIQPVKTFFIELQLVPAGKLPDGEVEMPFAFHLLPTTEGRPLRDTYQGVYVTSTYHAYATMARTLAKNRISAPVTLYVCCPGQGMPDPAVLAADTGIEFEMNSETLRKSKVENTPKFVMYGKIDRLWNDIDVPLSGLINIRECEFKIASVEIQLVRVEFCATKETVAKEHTEIQNIQIGEGDIQRNFEIPIYMMFPRWYTAPMLKEKHMRVDFDIHIVVTSQDRFQVKQPLSLKLYRST
jgi:hypothetical protein